MVVVEFGIFRLEFKNMSEKLNIPCEKKHDISCFLMPFNIHVFIYNKREGKIKFILHLLYLIHVTFSVLLIFFNS